jgi:hypothetical protein
LDPEVVLVQPFFDELQPFADLTDQLAYQSTQTVVRIFKNDGQGAAHLHSTSKRKQDIALSPGALRSDGPQPWVSGSFGAWDRWETRTDFSIFSSDSERSSKLWLRLVIVDRGVWRCLH